MLAHRCASFTSLLPLRQMIKAGVHEVLLALAFLQKMGSLFCASCIFISPIQPLREEIWVETQNELFI